MADKMMRMSGRGEDGTAKPLNTDNNGVLKTRGLNELLYEQSEAFVIPGGEKWSTEVNSAAPFLEVNIRLNASQPMRVSYSAKEVSSSGAGFLIKDKVIYTGTNLLVSLVIPTSGTNHTIAIDPEYTSNTNILGVFIRELDTPPVKAPNSSKSVPVTFGGAMIARFNGSTTLTSDPIDISHLNNLSLYMNNRTGATIYPTVIVEGMNFSYYDWNTEKMENMNVGTKDIAIPSQDQYVVDLTTFPTLYWFKNLGFDKVQIRLLVDDASLATNLVRVWIGGESNV